METLSESVQDYVKAIWTLREESREAEKSDGRESGVSGESGDALVTTQRLADYLGVAAPSATAMLKKLAQLRLVEHAPYRGVELTPMGEKAALEVVRHHRLIETYLTQVLGVPWDRVHDEAEKWEHVLSEDVEARMAQALNHPTHDPHGAPIPSVEGELFREVCITLSRLNTGEERMVRRVNDDDAAVLRHLQAQGLVPGARVQVIRHEPVEGVLHLRVDGQERLLGSLPAREVWMAVE